MPGLPYWEAIRNEGWSPEARVPAPISPHSDHGNGSVPRYQGQPRLFIQQIDFQTSQLGGRLPARGRWVRRTPDPWDIQGHAHPGHAGGGHQVPGCSAAAGPAPKRTAPLARPPAPRAAAAAPHPRPGVSHSGTESGQLQVMVRSRAAGHPGPLAPVPALSNVPCPVSLQPRDAGCERGCPRPSTTLTSCAATAEPRAGLPHPHKALEPVSAWGQHQRLPAGLSDARGRREHSADTHHVCGPRE